MNLAESIRRALSVVAALVLIAVTLVSIGPTVGAGPTDDSDADGIQNQFEDANADADGDETTNPGPDTDGDTVVDYLDPDDDGDGTPTTAENADPNADGNPSDAFDVDFDGQPDYLDLPTGQISSWVRDEQKISDTQGGFAGTLTDSLPWAESVASIGDLNHDGVTDLVVGHSFNFDGVANAGSVWVLFMNADGTVASHQQIGNSVGGFTGPNCVGCRFGYSVASLGDIDGDGVVDIAVGSYSDPGAGSQRGAVYILFLNTDGTVKAEQQIGDATGWFLGGSRRR